MKERRQPFVVDEAKFSTQRLVTYALLLIFTAVVTNVLIGNDQAERSTIIQTVINFMTFVVGFWIGTSKSAADKDASATRILEASAPAPGPAVTPAPMNPVTGVIPAVEAATAPENKP